MTMTGNQSPAGQAAAGPQMEGPPAIGSQGPRTVTAADPAYAEIGLIDPDGLGGASYEIVPGAVTRLTATVRRLTAPNPGFMTGPGTNAYLIGAGDDIAVIDPGPANDDHVNALLAAGGRIRWILATHTHPDHSPAAALLKARTGAVCIGLPPPAGGHQDQSFRPDIVLADGQSLALAGFTLKAMHTPGHASNHVCYLLDRGRILFTGDHIMQGSTVVINPPDGDMAAYLRSLRLLDGEAIDYIAPGHGFIIGEPRAMVERLVRHRLLRESKALGALGRVGPATLEALTPFVYDDVPAFKHPWASRSLLAHLLKLQADGRAAERDGIWGVA
jgi:glyoxylase-like metal-dependent hydrolase (beta-lactamase superfamily II)